MDRRRAVRRQPLATAEIVTAEGERVDLRNIRSPIICFCSKGDNITPPQQALGWIVDLYGSDDDIRVCGQTIVYSVHETSAISASSSPAAWRRRSTRSSPPTST